MTMSRSRLVALEVWIEHRKQKAVLVRSHQYANDIPWWLMASYLYYHHDVSILSDTLYDGRAKRLQDQWEVLDHPHKHLTELDNLQCGSLSASPLKSYPTIVRDTAKMLATELGHEVRGK
jgi:hypothetical protein